MNDIYREIYNRHINSKHEYKNHPLLKRDDANLTTVLLNRKSIRHYSEEEEISTIDITMLEMTISEYCPSSCNRKAIKSKLGCPIKLEKMLVGGSKWIDKASAVMLLFADKDAYFEHEISYMPYLDGGVALQTIHLLATYLDLASCIVNPNIHDSKLDEFNKIFNEEGNIFVGALALGMRR